MCGRIPFVSTFVDSLWLADGDSESMKRREMKQLVFERLTGSGNCRVLGWTTGRYPLAHARPSATKKLREQKRRERQQLKAEKRAQRKLAAQASAGEQKA